MKMQQVVRSSKIKEVAAVVAKAWNQKTANAKAARGCMAIISSPSMSIIMTATATTII
jgi:hypothetical protein